MAESAGSGRVRARRSTRVSRKLEAARRRNAEQLARQRAREQRVEEALAEFFLAADQQVTVEEAFRRRIEPHERAIMQARKQRDRLLAEQETAQARAALTIHEADRTVEQVAELLDMGVKDARRLIAAGREAGVNGTAASPTGAGTSSDTVASDGRAQVGREGVPSVARAAVSGSEASSVQE
ncbi:hypothetical protein AB0A74_26515 [Saccharothrix sp. NPDC042600]|uniref:hypothetical protein n=1 Tax=Saccharothrix TaxID=2071 RepID=UPI0033D6C875|nr:hypothetical protein GCM10017745_46390 [Saccharothrix mutabilis subsp. capreolus]